MDGPACAPPDTTPCHIVADPGEGCNEFLFHVSGNNCCPNGYVWDFEYPAGDTTTLSPSDTISHTFFTCGNFTVSATANVSCAGNEAIMDSLNLDMVVSSWFTVEQTKCDTICVVAGCDSMEGLVGWEWIISGVSPLPPQDTFPLTGNIPTAGNPVCFPLAPGSTGTAVVTLHKTGVPFACLESVVLDTTLCQPCHLSAIQDTICNKYFFSLVASDGGACCDSYTLHFDDGRNDTVLFAGSTLSHLFYGCGTYTVTATPGGGCLKADTLTTIVNVANFFTVTRGTGADSCKVCINPTSCNSDLGDNFGMLYPNAGFIISGLTPSPVIVPLDSIHSFPYCVDMGNNPSDSTVHVELVKDTASTAQGNLVCSAETAGFSCNNEDVCPQIFTTCGAWCGDQNPVCIDLGLDTNLNGGTLSITIFANDGYGNYIYHTLEDFNPANDTLPEIVFQTLGTHTIYINAVYITAGGLMCCDVCSFDVEIICLPKCEDDVQAFKFFEYRENELACVPYQIPQATLNHMASVGTSVTYTWTVDGQTCSTVTLPQTSPPPPVLSPNFYPLSCVSTGFHTVRLEVAEYRVGEDTCTGSSHHVIEVQAPVQQMRLNPDEMMIFPNPSKDMVTFKFP